METTKSSGFIQEIRQKYRVFDIALFDLVSSMIAVGLIMMLAVWIRNPEFNLFPAFLIGCVIAIPIGIFVHVIFGVNTQLNYVLGLCEKPNRNI